MLVFFLNADSGQIIRNQGKEGEMEKLKKGAGPPLKQ